MSTRTRAQTPAADSADAVARIALSRRTLLLGVHRDRLPREELEDCYSQATLELLARARSGPRLESTTHIAHALEQKFGSRILDRRRALAGRSPIEAAIGCGVSFDDPQAAGLEPPDPAAGVHERVVRRIDLDRVREVAAELSDDQRLVLFSQVSLGIGCDEFCRRHGWSPAKFRKVAQRARSRLASLVAEYGEGKRCRRLEPDLTAYVARVASDETRARVLRHLENCTACRVRARDLRLAEQALVAIVVSPAGIGGLSGSGALAGGVTAGAGVASGGSFLFGGAGALKAGMVALCVAGVTGGGVLLCSARPRARPADRRLPARITSSGREARPTVARAASVSSAVRLRTAPSAHATRAAAARGRTSSAGPVTREFATPLAQAARPARHARAAIAGPSQARQRPRRSGRVSSLAVGFEGG